MSKQTSFPTLADVRVLRKRDVLSATGLSDTSVRRLEARGLFPRRVALGDNAVGWLEVEIVGWLQNRATNGKLKLSGAVAPVAAKPAKAKRGGTAR
jgi:prophage regulatory protein